ncbi:hypothetical protein BYT27DRAFT_7101686 [Phlegmacium glaucopus]|nr:hypothetical protein BYT27DRAFT_7101686 [Phlegmacium glaucopus]
MADNPLSISVTTPTPPRSTSQSGNTPTPKTNGTPDRLPPSYRLLYRGALSLPDSLLLLDGLTFAARLNSPSKHNTFNLLQNPLALALESMRGRPSLRFMGTVFLHDVWLDESGGVEMDIHPHAILTRIYFENMFCLLPFSASSSSSSSKSVVAQRSEIGIKVALGDSNGPETTEIVIFAQLNSTADCSNTIQLSVARLAQRPTAQVQKRVPRPDDPIPRKPPAFFLQELKRTGSLGATGGELKRVPSGDKIGAGVVKRQKLMNGTGIAANLGSGVRLGVEDDRVFKVPEVPREMKGRSKGKEKEDVFGDITEVGRVNSVEGRHGKGKHKSKEFDEVALEKANKNTIKRATIEYLSRTKDPTNASRFIDKTHSDFKELYGFVYRGVGYALRAKIRQCEIDLGVMNRLIDMHALMYLGGSGGSAQYSHEYASMYNV